MSGAAPSLSPAPPLLRGFLLLSSGQLAARLLSLVALAYLARTLGIEMFGALGFAAAVASYAMLLVDGGLDLVGIQRISRDRSEADAVTGSILAARLLLGTAALLLLGLLAPWLATAPAWTPVVLAQGLTLLSFAANVRFALQALERNGPVAASFLLTQGLYLCGLLALVQRPEHAWRAPLAFVVADLAGALFVLAAYRRGGGRAWHGRSRSLASSLLRDALGLAGSRAVRALHINADLLLLGLAGTPAAVGLYTACSRVVLAIRELGDLYHVPLLPALTRAAGAGPGRFAVELSRVLRVAAAGVLPLLVVGWLRTEELLALAFGPEFATARDAMRLLFVASVVVILGGTFRVGLIALGRQASLLPISTAGALLSLALNLVLIPRLSFKGAAATVLLSELVVAILSVAAVRRSAPVPLLAPLVRPAIAAAALAALLAALPALSLAPALVVAAGGYATLAVVLGAVRISELTSAFTPRTAGGAS